MRGKKHKLLIYARAHRQRRWSLFIAGALFVGLYALPYLGLLDAETVGKLWPPQFDGVLLGLGVVCFLLFFYKLVAPRLAYVRCTPRNIRIQTPLYPVFISYRRIAATRPNQWGRVFPPDGIKRGQRRLLDGVWGEGVLILDLKGWPIAPALLRLWMPDVMLLPDGIGLVLWVEDWMTLSREISEFMDRRREASLGPRPDASIYSRMKKS